MGGRALPNPYGCDICGVDHDRHGWRWNKVGGNHLWTAPSDWKILARMQVRRTLREQRKGDAS